TRSDLKELPDATAWKSLTELHLQSNEHLTTFTALGSLGALRVLDLNDSKIKSLTPVAKLAQLEDLALDRTPLRTLQPLHQLKSLQRVVVPAEMPLSERAALKKALPAVVVEQPGPTKDQVFMRGSKCFQFIPGCCLCGEGVEVPCPATK
ncbi:MAG: hypothetical protein ABI175_27445, partial [Polyangiales bacterium]